MRKLMWLTIGFAAASFLGTFLSSRLLLALFALAILATGTLVFFTQRSKICKLIMFVTLGCSLGTLWFGVYDHIFVTLPRTADGQILYVTIEATDYNVTNDNGNSVEGTVFLSDQEYRVKAYLNTDEVITPGDLVRGTFRFRLTTSGGLQTPTNHRSEGIFLLAYPSGKAEIVKAEEIPLEYYPAVWRRQLCDRIHEIFPGDAGGFAAALLLGDRSGVTYEMNTAFKVSGVSHIIAVSGLHISILFALVYTLLARRRVLSCLIGIPILVLFAAIAGFTPSITRACIMQSLMLIAMLFDREYDGPTALSFAVLVMLAINPLTILSVSFQLSVGCMVGIFLFSERIRTYLHKFAENPPIKGKKFLARLYKGAASSVAVSLSASVVTTPLVAYYFGCISAVSILTNLIVLWIISFLFYGLILVLLLSMLSMGFAQIVGSIFAIPIGFVLWATDVISKLPMSALYTSNIFAVVWLIGIYGLLILFLCQKHKKPMLFAICAVVTFLLVNVFSWLEPAKDDFRVTMLDVGQGQSILLQSDGKTFLVDCGGDYDMTAADVAAEALLNQGISKLDGIILTHYDDDHAGGVSYLLTRLECDRLILPDCPDGNDFGLRLAEQTDGAVQFITSDVIYRYDQTEMTIFAPNSYGSANESSICILFRREDCAILITGDRGFGGEQALLSRYDFPKVNVLVAGHHGSADSTSSELLEAVDPDYVWISVGADNRYGHPAEELLWRLEENGCIIYRTDINGTIIFRR